MNSGYENSLGYVWPKKFKNDIETTLKPTGFELLENPNKTYNSVYICNRKIGGPIAEWFSFFRSHCFKYHKLNKGLVKNKVKHMSIAVSYPS